MLARRDTRREASRLRRLSPLQTLEDQSQTWGIYCHSCTGREGLSPSWKLSYKTEVLRFTREPRSSFNQRIARILMSHVILTMISNAIGKPMFVETVLSMLTLVCHVKKVMHRGWAYFQARLAFTVAAFNVLVQWYGLQPNASGFVPLSIAEFSL